MPNIKEDKASRVINIASFVIGALIVGLIIILLLSSYTENLNLTEKQEDKEEDITDFNFDDLDLDFGDVEDIEDLVIETIEEGDGEEAKDGDTLTLHYTGRLLDGTVFDSSHDRGEPFSFTLGAGQVIQGWDEGIKGMEVGEKRMLKIPSTMGYGEMGSGANIPPNAGLEFEVELLEIN